MPEADVLTCSKPECTAFFCVNCIGLSIKGNEGTYAEATCLGRAADHRKACGGHFNWDCFSAICTDPGAIAAGNKARAAFRIAEAVENAKREWQDEQARLAALDECQRRRALAAKQCIEELQTKCPGCDRLVAEPEPHPDRCFAMYCAECATYSCAFCQYVSPNNGDNHTHVMNCIYNAVGTLFPNYPFGPDARTEKEGVDMWRDCHNLFKADKIRAILHELPQEDRDPVLEAVRDNLNIIGITASVESQEWRPHGIVRMRKPRGRPGVFFCGVDITPPVNPADRRGGNPNVEMGGDYKRRGTVKQAVWDLLGFQPGVYQGAFAKPDPRRDLPPPLPLRAVIELDDDD